MTAFVTELSERETKKRQNLACLRCFGLILGWVATKSRTKKRCLVNRQSVSVRIAIARYQ